MKAYQDLQMIRKIVENISNALKSSYYVSRKEPEIVREFVNRANAIAPYGPIRVRAHFIHQKPIISFVSTFPNNRSRCELGDILFINKRIVNGKLNLHKSSLSQVKKSLNANNYLMIPRHQLEFYSRPYLYPFRFGWKTRLLRPTSRWYAHFLSISHVENFCFSFFTPPSSSWARSPHVAVRYFEDFLTLFAEGRLGENLLRSGTFHDLVADVYKFTGASPDPPEEFEGYKEEGGFGIVELVTILEGEGYE